MCFINLFKREREKCIYIINNSHKGSYLFFHYFFFILFSIISFLNYEFDFVLQNVSTVPLFPYFLQRRKNALG